MSETISARCNNDDEAIALCRLVEHVDPKLRAEIASVTANAAGSLVAGFYREMQNRPDATSFLDHELVETRLKRAMHDWVLDLFRPYDLAGIERFVSRQKQVGDRHARINIPVSTLQVATGLLKKELLRQIVGSQIDRARLADAIIHVDEMVDAAVAIMNRVYLKDLMADVRDQQTLKLQSIGIDMALQTENLRASLFDWHRQILLVLYDETITADRLPSIRRTSFGLWVLHKGELLFPGSAEIEQLKHVIEEVDKHFGLILGNRPNLMPSDLRQLLAVIDEYVTGATAVLSSMTDRTLAMEGGKDPLTRLFNRRFLRTILQREVRMSATTGDRFAVLLLDIDHFKSLNDQYGHEVGDVVLRQLAELLVNTLRAGDFVFRYGGEEFLIVVSGVDAAAASVVAEKVRSAVAAHPFTLADQRSLTITCSLGLTIHDGHPDYSKLIVEADNALYRAKREGRDRWILYQWDRTPATN